MAHTAGKARQDQLEVPQMRMGETPIHDDHITDVVVLPPVEPQVAGQRMIHLAVHRGVQVATFCGPPEEVLFIAPDEEILVGQADLGRDPG